MVLIATALILIAVVLGLVILERYSLERRVTELERREAIAVQALRDVVDLPIDTDDDGLTISDLRPFHPFLTALDDRTRTALEELDARPAIKNARRRWPASLRAVADVVDIDDHRA